MCCILASGVLTNQNIEEQGQGRGTETLLCLLSEFGKHSKSWHGQGSVGLGGVAVILQEKATNAISASNVQEKASQYI